MWLREGTRPFRPRDLMPRDVVAPRVVAERRSSETRMWPRRARRQRSARSGIPAAAAAASCVICSVIFRLNNLTCSSVMGLKRPPGGDPTLTRRQYGCDRHRELSSTGTGSCRRSLGDRRRPKVTPKDLPPIDRSVRDALADMGGQNTDRPCALQRHLLMALRNSVRCGVLSCAPTPRCEK